MNNLESLKNIFKGRIFRIPDYQRGYAWTKPQLKDFWEDLINLQPKRFHYTGLLSLKEVDNKTWENWPEEKWLIEGARGYTPFYVIDGQQRLTTIIILLQEIINLVKNLKENENKKEDDIYIGTISLKNIKEDYLVIQKPPEFIINTYLFGYEEDNPSFKYLKHCILEEKNSGSLIETVYTFNLQNAKNIFKENLSNYYDAYGLEGIEELFEKVTIRLMFNLHEISDELNVFVAFETMNNRGKKLSNLEILKNRLIYLTTLYSDIEINKEEQQVLRKDINDSLKEVYFELGRNKNKILPDDDFLQAHWIIYFTYSRNKGEDYKKFLLENKFTPKNIYEKIEIELDTVEDAEEMKENIDDDDDINNEEENKAATKSKVVPSDIKQYVNSLKEASRHWYNSFNPINNSELTDDESEWMDKLNRIGIGYFRPLVIASFMNEDIKPEERVALFKEIERFIFIVFRIGRGLSTYGNSEFFKVSKQLFDKKTTIEEIVKSLRSKMEWLFDTNQNNEKVFKTSIFKSYIERLHKNNEGFYSWNGRTYFFYEYELNKVAQTKVKKIDWNVFINSEKDKVSIEHIYPQSGENAYWKERFSKYNETERKLLLNSLGNLVPLSSSVNSSLQNDGFDDKKTAKYVDGVIVRRGYLEGSNSEIEVGKNTDWTAHSIYNRGEKLLEFMQDRWNFKFDNSEDRKDLLLLSFVKR